MANQAQDGGSTRTVLIALGVNVVVAVAKAVGGVVSGSSAMLSEAAHSVADTLNELFLLAAIRGGDRPADDLHPFGYGKARFFWSLLAAVGIFVAGAMFSFFQGYQTLTERPGAGEGTSYVVPYVVLGLAFVAEGVSFVRAVLQLRGEARHARQGLFAYISGSDDPTVKTVASEDSAALVGLLIAFVGILLSQLTGDQFWQAIASFLIGALLVVLACGLGRENMGLLIGESADPALRRRLTEALLAYDEVDEVFELLTMSIGTRRLLVAVRLDFATNVSSDHIEQVSTRIDEDLHARFPAVDQLFLDATARTDRRRREVRGT
jgi:cation diffusion facilitator family transporter